MENSKDRLSWISKELGKRTILTAFTSALIIADALGIGMIISSLYRYGLNGISEILILMSTVMIFYYLVKNLVRVLVQSNWLWQQRKREIDKNKGI
ncbi:MAG: hypothetical protein ACI4CS_11775 [Candidatus Weimeria sp.]